MDDARLFRALFEETADPIVVVDERGVVARVNAACADLLGYRPGELVGRPVEVLVPERFAGHRAEREAYAAGPRPRAMGRGLPLYVRHRDGGEIPVDVSLTPSHLAGCSCTIAVLRDMRGRAHGPDALRLQAIALRSAANGIVITDRTGTITWVNPAACAITGYGAAELLGRHTRILKSGLHDPGFYRSLWSTIERGETWSGTITNRRKDGTLYDEEQTIAPVVDERGEVTHFIAIKQDITARRRAERELEAAHAELGRAYGELRRAQEQISRLSAPSAQLLESTERWADAMAAEVTRALGARAVSVWVLREGREQAFERIAGAAPEESPYWRWDLAASGELWLAGDEEPRWVFPARGTAGEPRGAVVVQGKGLLSEADRHIVQSFAHHLGTALELRRFRHELSAAEARRAASRQEMRSRGIAPVDVCPACGLCAEQTAACPADGTAMDTSLLLPLVVNGRYRLTRRLAEGGMGTVFSARDERLGREVALKLVRPQALQDAAVRFRFEREAQTIARIRHPGVVALHDSGDLEDGGAFLVMELVDGVDLGTVLDERGRGTPAEVASLLRQVASALAAAHQAGVVHRDVTPGNILLVPREGGGFRAKLVDFGIARSTRLDDRVTLTGTVVGTPLYMSPEQVRGLPVDERSDLYSLAAVAYEALLGRTVFPREGDAAAQMMAVVSVVPPAPSSFLPALPPELDTLFAAALAKSPGDRPLDLRAWAERCAGLLAQAPPEAAPAAGWTALPSMPGRAGRRRSKPSSATAATAPRSKVVAVALVLAALAACGRAPQAAGRRPGRALVVRAAPVTARDVVYTVQALGSLEPDELVQIPAEVTGAVKEVRFEAGDAVTPETPLLRIDPERYRLQAEGAEAAHRKAVAEWKRAESELARREELGRVQLVAVEELSRARQESERLAAAAAAAKAELGIALQNRDRAVVRAPRAGEINTRTVQTGQYVKVGDVLATLVDPRRLRLRFRVSESESLSAAEGQEVSFRVPSLGDGRFTARVYHVSDVADPGTRQVEVLAWVRNPGPLKPGFFAEVALATATRKGAVVVAESAVRASERGFVVFVVERGTAQERAVQLGLRTGDGAVEIVSGVRVHETVVTEGSDRLAGGMPVEIAEGKGPREAQGAAP